LQVSEASISLDMQIYIIRLRVFQKVRHRALATTIPGMYYSVACRNQSCACIMATCILSSCNSKD